MLKLVGSPRPNSLVKLSKKPESAACEAIELRNDSQVSNLAA